MPTTGPVVVAVTVMLVVPASVPVVGLTERLTLGATMMSLLLAKDCPAGIVKVALFPAASVNVAPAAKVIAVELRSVLFSPAAGVYVPTADVPVKGARVTVPPVSKVTLMLPLAKITASLKLTVTLMLSVVP